MLKNKWLWIVLFVLVGIIVVASSSSVGLSKDEKCLQLWASSDRLNVAVSKVPDWDNNCSVYGKAYEEAKFAVVQRIPAGERGTMDDEQFLQQVVEEAKNRLSYLRD